MRGSATRAQHYRRPAAEGEVVMTKDGPARVRGPIEQMVEANAPEIIDADVPEPAPRAPASRLQRCKVTDKKGDVLFEFQRDPHKPHEVTAIGRFIRFVVGNRSLMVPQDSFERYECAPEQQP